MATINVQELRRIVKVAESNVGKWQGECLAANKAYHEGDHEPLARAGRGALEAGDLVKALKNLLGWATGWPEHNGWGIFQPAHLPVAVPDRATCVFDGCEKPQHSRGLCATHYHAVHHRAAKRKPCVAGRNNHAYNLDNRCIHCNTGRPSH